MSQCLTYFETVPPRLSFTIRHRGGLHPKVKWQERVAKLSPALNVEIKNERCSNSTHHASSSRLYQSFSTAGPWHQLYRAARGLRKLQYATRFH